MDETLEFDGEVTHPRQPLERPFDLEITDGAGRKRRAQMGFDEWSLGNPGPGFAPNYVLSEVDDTQIRVLLRFHQGQLLILNQSPRLQVEINGRSLDSVSEIWDGDEVSLGSHILSVRGLPPAPASLEGFSHPHLGQRFILQPGQNLVGRAGSRKNQLELADPTVSRAQASLSLEGSRLRLLNEVKPNQTRVNGLPVEGTVELVDKDMLQFGRQMLRLRFSQGQHGHSARGPQVGLVGLRLPNDPDLDDALVFGRLLELVAATPSARALPYGGDDFWVILKNLQGAALANASLQLGRQLATGARIAVVHCGRLPSPASAIDYEQCSQIIDEARSLFRMGSAEHQLITSRSIFERCDLPLTLNRVGSVRSGKRKVRIEAYRVEESESNE